MAKLRWCGVRLIVWKLDFEIIKFEFYFFQKASGTSESNIVEVLLNSGAKASIDDQDKNGDTSLIWGTICCIIIFKLNIRIFS